MTAFRLEEAEVEGMRLGQELPSGAVVWLEGNLGAGKTTLVRAIVAGRGAGADASSPTYNLVHHYRGPRGAVYHVDCYRMRDPDDAADLDWETLVRADLLLIEWPRRGGAWVPAPTCEITLAWIDDDTREMTIR